MVTVFGSLNLDITVTAGRMPLAGETIFGEGLLMSPGGKGANQAHAARRFGAPTRLFGMVGDDPFARLALDCLRAADVELAGVGVSNVHSTGVAIITVTPNGENSIVVVPGANGASTASQVSDAVLLDTRLVLMQQEVPVHECRALARRARALGCLVILNASPMALSGAADLADLDILVVNAIELAQAGAAMQLDAADPQTLALRLAADVGVDVLVTLGAQGAMLAQPDGCLLRCPALAVAVVDTTGAGDTFAGVFAAAIAQGMPRAAAMQAASVAAGLCCMNVGAQLSQPDRHAIEVQLAQLPPMRPPHTNKESQ